MKSHVHPVHTNLLRAQETKVQETVLLVLPAITVPWDRLSSTFVHQVITAEQVVVYQHNAEQELTTL